MANVGFAGQHSTTNAVQTAKTSIEDDTTYYLKTIPGILKILEIAFNFLGFVCIEASDFSNHPRGTWFNIVALTGLLGTAILLASYLFHTVDKHHHLPWHKMEFTFCAILTICYLIASSLAVTYYNDAYIAAGIFGFCAMVVYGIDAALKLISILKKPV